jgi:hypothetical protein
MGHRLGESGGPFVPKHDLWRGGPRMKTRNSICRSKLPVQRCRYSGHNATLGATKVRQVSGIGHKSELFFVAFAIGLSHIKTITGLALSVGVGG